MNKDVYDFYLTAREDTSRGHLKRLKALWDAKYPQFNTSTTSGELWHQQGEVHTDN